MSEATRRWLGAVCTGGCLALAFPYPDLHTLVWVALVPLFLVLRGASVWQCWWAGLLAGFVWRVGSLYWVTHVVTTYGGIPGPLGVGVAGLLAVWMALNTGLVCMLVPQAFRWGPGGAVALAAAWVSLEYLQTLLPFGFPWSLLGYAAGRAPAMMQAADLAGVWGLSFLAVFVNAAIALRASIGRRALPASVAAAGLLVATLLYGGFRLAEAPPLGENASGAPPHDAAAIRVASVQGNVEQGRVWDSTALASILQHHVGLSLTAAAADADLVMWSESSVPIRGGLERDSSTRLMLSQLARQEEITMVVGSPHIEYDEAGRASATNAAFVVGAGGDWGGRYDKVHLVPWGEYVPIRWLFRFVAPLVEGVAGFRHGEADQPLLDDTAHGVPPFGMAICYEVVFPDHLRRQVERGATFLATITNDAWFGDTSAPYQHFSMARLRAVENRRYLVRAANTGISGMVDPWGRVLEMTALDESALAMATIVPRTDRSLYVVWGDLLARLCVVLGAVAAVLAWRSRFGPGAEPGSGHAAVEPSNERRE